MSFNRSHQLQSVIRTSNCNLFTVGGPSKMETNICAVKSSASIAVCPMKFTDHSPKIRSSFMVEDLVRDPNNFKSAWRARYFPDSSYSDTMQAPTNEEINSGKQDSGEQSIPRVRSNKSRSSFSVEQVFQLERVFERQKYLGSRDRQRIAEQLQMTETQVKTWFQNRRMKMKKKQTEAAERSAELSFLNNLSFSMQPNFHGYQPHYPASPSGSPRVLCPGLSPPECAWAYQTPLHFPLNQPATRFLPPPYWDCLPQDMIGKCATALNGYVQSDEPATFSSPT